MPASFRRSGCAKVNFGDEFFRTISSIVKEKESFQGEIVNIYKFL